MVIKLALLKFGIGVLRIMDWGFRSPIPNLKNTNPQIKIPNWYLYHKLVISTFNSLLGVYQYQYQWWSLLQTWLHQ